jgi:hypothetical protein
MKYSNLYILVIKNKYLCLHLPKHDMIMSLKTVLIISKQQFIKKKDFLRVENCVELLRSWSLSLLEIYHIYLSTHSFM